MSPALSTTTMAALARAHHSAEAVVQTILAIADSLEQARRIDTSLLTEVVFFLRTFSDKCQTAEEDALLFPAIEAKCMPPGSRLIENLRNDHQNLVTLTAELSEAADEYAAANNSGKERLASTLRRLAKLYSEHLRNEDYVMLPLAEKILSSKELNALLQAFQRIESEISLDEVATKISLRAQRCRCHMGEVFI